jgi:hypothetical protein
MSRRVRTFELVGDRRSQGEAPDMSAASRPCHRGYTTLRTYGGRRVLRLGTALRRLEDSAALLVGRARSTRPPPAGVWPRFCCLWPR